MNVTLGLRTADHVRIYFEKAKDPRIQKTLPQKAQTIEEALADYEATLLEGATSYGRIILADGKYVGDIWCYCIDHDDTPNAMLSYCVFDSEYQNRSVATTALALFLKEIKKKYSLETVGAFTFADNIPSIKVLEKNDFKMMEEFVEDGILSKYLEKEI